MGNSPEKVVDALRASLKETGRLREQNRQLAAAAREPIAIVGMACRYPGGVGTPEQLWDLVTSNGDSISEFPTDRGWDLSALYDPDPAHLGTAYTRHGGFLHDAAEFDPGFFGISPREAVAMDPQHRLLLETAWDTFEDAGIDPTTLKGTRTGVYAGVMYQDYAEVVGQGDNLAEGFMGVGGSIATGRVSFTFGFEGPAVTVDTACSSSLVALHLAAQALRTGECTLALAGGVTVMTTPQIFVEFSRQRGLSVDGRCKPFAAAADGTGWAEGAGLILLERLSDAQRNGHQVLAVVRGSAINQDGASNGLTAPNGPSQQRVIRQALANARLSADQVDVVEAHGTGTPLGDPIEAQALLATYGQDRAEPLWLGSIKSNIGHTQAAAGVASVIKMVQAMRHGVMPRTLHVDEPTPHVDWSAGAVELLTEQRVWETDGSPRRAAVSSFGISGTNAHVILEEAPAEGVADVPVSGGVVPWVLSGKTPEAVRAQAERLMSFVEERPDLSVANIAYSLVSSRAALESRAVAVGSSRDELLASLAALLDDPAAVTAPTGPGGRVVLVFPGQGSQWVGMAEALWESSPVFGARMQDCAEALAQHVDWSLREVVADSVALARVDVVQPVLWAVMVSLAEVWRSLGVVPAAVVGHSQGEIAAACVAGALSLEDGARVVALRSRAILKLAGQGGMVSLSCPLEIAREVCASVGASIAAVNGAEQIVVSGTVAVCDQVVSDCERRGVRARRIEVDYASHSPQVEGLRDELLDVLRPITPVKGTVPVVSTVTGEWLSGEEMDAEYWVDNLRRTVQFSAAIADLQAQGCSTFVESSAHPVLTTAIGDTIADGVVVGTLRRDQGDLAQVLRSAGQLWAAGVPVDWAGYLSTGWPEARRVSLPTYAFQRQRFWPAAGGFGGDASGLGLGVVEHPLLGAAVSIPETGGVLLTGRLSVDLLPWLADHRVAGHLLLPGTALVELAIRAGDEIGCPSLDELTLQAPLVLPESGAMQVQVWVDAPDEHGRRPVRIYSRAHQPDDPTTAWTHNATGTLTDTTPATPQPLDAWPPAGATPIDLDGFYEHTASAGLAYGPVFQGLGSAWEHDGNLYAEVALPEDTDASRYALHPALLDAALHPLLTTKSTGGTLSLPFAWAGVALYATGATALRVKLTPEGTDRYAVLVADTAGAPVASADSLTVRPLAEGGLDGPARSESLFTVNWVKVPLGEAEPVSCAVISGSDARLTAAFPNLETSTGLDALRDLDVVPEFVFAVVRTSGDDSMAANVRAATTEMLGLLQDWLAEERFDSSRLVVLTTGAVPAQPGEHIRDLAQAAVIGLVRTAQTENPGRIVLVDLDDDSTPLPAALATGEPELALRGGVTYAPRLARAASGDGLVPPADEYWHLGVSERGSLGNLGLFPFTEAAEPLGDGEVRIEVHAAGMNFRDALNALGMYPGDPGDLGAEAAGVVLDIGPGVTGLVPGDRVTGIMGGGFGTVAVTDHHLLVKIPDDWSFVTAASVPVVFATAYYGLVDLADLRAGESVLVHAVAGGVGMAATQLAHHLGATVFGTASRGKWATANACGVSGERLASSRDLGFEEQFRAATGGAGVDVILNSLTGEFVDASARLLPRGGRFVEMGKIDIRDAADVAVAYPGVRYQAFDVLDAGKVRLGEILAELMRLFEVGALRPLPITAWDVRQAPEAFRQLSQAKHTGKLVLTTPSDYDKQGAYLVTGASGVLGGVIARHLVREHGVSRLVLLSRRGIDAPGMTELRDELVSLGAEVAVTACDAADRAALTGVLEGLPEGWLLRGVVHSAGVLDDGVLGSMTPERIDAVLRPKVDAAWNLHELTTGLDLTHFVLFSSAAGTFGTGGQANYAAANAFVDALASRRRAAGLPATSLAWGLWADASEMTGQMTERDVSRVGSSGLSQAEGLAAFDAALALGDPVVIPMNLRLPPASAATPALLRGLVRGANRRTVEAGPGSFDALRRRLEVLDQPGRVELVMDLVRAQAGAVLGYGSADQISPRLAFKDLGFDSLTAVELRNRLQAATGLRLSATLVFDFPNATALATELVTQLIGDERATAAPVATVPTVTASDEPIAIIGMACNLPGGVRTPDELWDLVVRGEGGITPFPTDRGWDVENLYHPDPDHPGTSYTREGGFLQDAGDFDPAFFGISPREALAMDPQQRLLLEVSWEALERAGLDLDELRGSRTGVFAGLTYHDYGSRLEDESDTAIDGFVGSGNSGSVVSGRISYTFGFEGPAVTVDTACSSSLVALHWAMQSLRSGECTMALAGGVTVMATPTAFVDFSRQRGLAADGRCKAFSSTADGTGWGEGVGMLVVERLSDAQRLGHRVLAVVRGSAINQDGASNGLTAPNGPSQQRVIRQALANAGVAASDVDVVEAHGTGTTLGDPIEAQALLATYGQDRGGDPLWLGSVKSNLGHTQAAAGVAGVIKMVQAMRHGVLPQTLHVDEPTPHVDWSEGNVELLTESRVWVTDGRPRRAGVSSFGISGTNAHVILEQAPNSLAAEAPNVSGVVPWVLSGKNSEAVRAQALRLRAFVEDRPGLSVVDVAYSLATTRGVMDQRAAVVGPTREDLLAGLASVSVVGESGRVGVVFTGQGAQWAGMAAGLYGKFDVFTEAVDEICALMGLEPSAVTDPDAVVDPTGTAQRVLFMIEVALWRQLQAWGVKAEVVAGHSVGEISAAHVAGVLSLEDACVLVSARAKLMQALPEGGVMVSVAASEDSVAPLLVDGVSIAAVNGPTSVVLSGPEASVTAVADALAAGGVKTRELRVSHAFHSALMEPMLADFADAISGIDFGIPSLAGVSTVTGAAVTSEWSDPEYWVRQVREPVRFADAITTLAAGVGVVLEIGPDAVLSAMGPDNVSGDVAFIPTLRRNRDTETELVQALARLHTHGVTVDWKAFFAPYKPSRVELPTYAFQRQRFWPTAGRSRGDASGLGMGVVEHPLLGAAMASAESDRVVLSGRISLREQSWLADHVVAGVVLLPGTAFVEMAVRAGDEVGCTLVEELTLQTPLVVPDAGAVHVQVIVGEPGETGRRSIDVYSRPADSVQREWVLHASGTLTNGAAGVGQGLVEWPPAGATRIDVDGFYDQVADHGLVYGPVFQGLRKAWRRGEELFAEVALDDSADGDVRAFGIHPALLDAALHTLLLRDGKAADAGPSLPFSWSGVSLTASGASSVRVHVRADGALLLADSTGAELATVDSLVTRVLDAASLQASVRTESLFAVSWSPVSAVAGDVTGNLLRATGDSDVRARTVWALGELQEWLRSGEGVLVVATCGSVAALDGDQIVDLAGSAVWGLVRSAQSEHPGRFVLLDTDTPEALDTLDLAEVVATSEPQLVLRGGVLYSARLNSVTANAGGGWGDGSVLITGASGALGGVVVRHLVEQGVPGLVLVSRRGGDAPGMAELVEWVRGRGVQVSVAAADVADREHVEMVLGLAPVGLPVTSVVHAAGVLDDGVVESLTPQQVEAVLAPKADAAWNLHEATLGLDLSRFVLFSSAAGVFGNAGQANYAAANAYLDVLAAYRIGRGLPAASLAWGLWQRGMADSLNESDRRRLGRALSDEEGMALFELASAGGVWVPTHLDLAGFTAGAAEVPALLRGLVRRPTRRVSRSHDTELATRLSGLDAVGAHAVLMDMVCAETAAVLGFTRSEQVDPAQSFGEIGFDSLTAVELRNRLSAATGVRLPATLVFDYPNPEALAGLLVEKLVVGRGGLGLVVGAESATVGEPIAIVGMACRYPGGVGSPEELWSVLCGGGDVVSLFPTDRGWDVEGLYHPDPDHPGTSYAREGGFLHNAAEFDAGFFGLSPREAVATDPQQRLLLETSWEAFESAGIDPRLVRGSKTGVFAGVMHYDYASVVGNAIESGEGFVGTGATGGVLSGRVSYTFGFEGPAVTVDTACSSSLVALHLAAQALRQGECDLALAGGVTVMATPGVFVGFSRQRGLAPDGRCKPFAAAADGTGWGEGVGMLLVERLSDAKRNGHPILAVVAGSAVNQDGASSSLTAPNGPSQQRVIRQALANAGVSASDVDAVEAHGTGTTLGDPIEAQALLATYGQDRTEPLWLGSIKSNIGHTQAAAGVAGVIKMVQAMRHGVLPRTLHVDEPTPHVDWSEGNVELLTESRVWDTNGRPRRAGVSSFGISGTNAHVILEQAPDTPVVPGPVSSGVVPWILSGKSSEAVRAQALRLRSFVEDRPGLSVVDVAYSLATTRGVMDQRAAVVGPTREDLVAGLASVDVVGGFGRVGVVFTGQGAQWAGMAAGLYGKFPVFTRTVDEICALMDLSPAVVTDPDAVVDPTGIAQRVLFMIEVALWRQLQAWGLKAEVVAGHSVGEISAAHVAGVLSLEDACVLVSARAKLMQALPEGGAMVSVAASEDAVAPLVVDGVSIAAVNGPASVVLSGIESAVDQVLAGLDVKTRKLRVSHAFHSALMEPMLADFADAISGIEFGTPILNGVSTVTGAAVSDEWSDPGYWVRQVREPVRFADAIATFAAGVGTVLEIGPDAVLSAMGPDNVPDVAFVPTLRRNRDTEIDLVQALARLHTHGVTVDWEAFFAPYKPNRVDLPTYAFQRQHYWPSAAPLRGDVATAGLGAVEHPLLGAVMTSADLDRVTLSGRISLREQPWLGDHVVAGMVLFPGAAFVEMAVRAGDEVGCDLIEELTLRTPLVLSGAVHLQVTLGEPDENGRRGIDIYSRPEDQPEWTHHATGTLGNGAAGMGEGLTEWPPAGATRIEVDGFYDQVADHGLTYGPVFQGLRQAWRRGEDLFAEVTLDDSGHTEAFGIHPALLDAALHTLLLKAGETGEPGPSLPFSWRGVALKASGASGLRVHARADGTLLLADSTGAELATVDELLTRTLPLGQLQHAPQPMYRVEWRPSTHAAGDPVAVGLFEVDDLGLADTLSTVDEPPNAAFLSLAASEQDPAASAHTLTHRTLAALQAWLAEDRGETVPLVVVTKADDLASAAVQGLVRSAQSENPGRFVLVDIDEKGLTADVLSAVLASGEPEVAVRGSEVLVPRLVKVAGRPSRIELDTDGTVLVTGATGVLGRRFARHLVSEYGVRRLLLVSRSGSDAPGAGELVDDLTGLGAEVVVAAADVADRDALRTLLDSVEHPITAVVHTAGVLDDGVLASLTPERFDTVLRPKVDAAWNLHELTADLPLRAFVLFSSVSGVLGGPGQANYAAANAFLDALASHRKAAGLSATALAWGRWAETSAMTGGLSDADEKRMARSGMGALSSAEGVALFDAALGMPDARPVPVRLEIAALRAHADAGLLPPVLTGVLPSAARRRTASAAVSSADLGARLGAMPEKEAFATVLDLVLSAVRDVLGHVSVDAAASFNDLGFDSLTAVEFRNRLTGQTGLRLPATLIFDYPTAEALGRYLHAELVGAQTGQPSALTAFADLDRLESALAGIDDVIARDRITGRLRDLLALFSSAPETADAVAGRMATATDDEMFAFIDGDA
ncbi:hypothetical protein ALI144C_17115 [Actinosynnema sp. ALI-1.44]|uniref:type I polyketide synthase n=1 Tax=Actinosynnema sp. ALI-1.44 TaxID=1933779 RepID=UPI00097BAC86|nr:type I polyketide synthase [Actinosynnema sp. ALI-1.44]ONI83214.1 hypothetical protein ALI144C_17115 [Actinosynnema sp. ALI-1.44]